MLAERYGEHMRTYMRAAEQITRMPLDRCVLFALCIGARDRVCARTVGTLHACLAAAGTGVN